MRRVQGVYAVVHVPSGYQYIGSSIDIHRRWKEHRNALVGRRHYCALLQTSWNCHEANDFRIQVLEEVGDLFQLTVREQAWLERTPLRFNQARAFTE